MGRRLAWVDLCFLEAFLASYVGLTELRMEHRGAEEGVQAATAVGGPQIKE